MWGKGPNDVAEGRFTIKFSTIAIFFIMIGIRLMFIWPWAVIYRRLGWFGFAEMMVFLGVLMLGFLYIWRKGGLEWDYGASSRPSSTRPSAGRGNTRSSSTRS